MASSSSGPGARQTARTAPAHLIVFDVLDTTDVPLLDEPYRARRALLETLLADGVLAAPFVLCPATTDRATAEDWLDPAWGAAGIEGVVVKGLSQKYQPARRGWIKVWASASAEAVVASVTGRVAAPSTLLPAHRADSTAAGGCATGGRRPALPGRGGASVAAPPLRRRLGLTRDDRLPAGGARRGGRVRRGHRGGRGPLPASRPLPSRKKNCSGSGRVGPW